MKKEANFLNKFIPTNLGVNVKEIQRDATVRRYLFTVRLLYMFGRPSCPSSGVHKTAVAASGTDHTIWGASFFKRHV